MTRVIRLFVLIEGITFIIAALTHFGVLIGGYEHHLAGRAESVIGIVLLAGLALTCSEPSSGYSRSSLVSAPARYQMSLSSNSVEQWQRLCQPIGLMLSR